MDPDIKNPLLRRIVAMASLFEQLGSVKWEDLEGYKTKDSSLFEYSNSKLVIIMMARELNKRLKVGLLNMNSWRHSTT